jgi:hypothetical protein
MQENSAKIVKARIEPSKKGSEYTMAKIIAEELSDGRKEVKVLNYFDDEISFYVGEVEGKTLEEVQQLFTKKDIAYLQS